MTGGTLTKDFSLEIIDFASAYQLSKTMTQSIINTSPDIIPLFLFDTMTDKEFLNNWFNLDSSKEGQNLVILNLDNQLTQNIPDTFLT